MKLSRSFCFLIFATFVIESGLSQDNSIDSSEKVKKLKSSKKDISVKKKLLQKAKVKALKTDNKDDKLDKDVVQTTPTTTTTQGIDTYFSTKNPLYPQTWIFETHFTSHKAPLLSF